jgi:hypothetical protein
MHCRGTVEGIQLAALDPAKARFWKDRERDESRALQAAADRAMAMMGLDGGRSD